MPGRQLNFTAEIIEWRGPAPFFYAPLPADKAAEISAQRKALSYGWGVIPVAVTIGGVQWTTSLFPKDGTYLLPLKDKVRRALGVTVGDTVKVEMRLGG
jgi:hypothetical protein